jgi:hypothetical protein
MSVLSLVVTQMASIWKLRASIARAAHLIPETATDSTTCFDSINVISRAAWHANCIQ